MQEIRSIDREKKKLSGCHLVTEFISLIIDSAHFCPISTFANHSSCFFLKNGTGVHVHDTINLKSALTLTKIISKRINSPSTSVDGLELEFLFRLLIELLISFLRLALFGCFFSHYDEYWFQYFPYKRDGFSPTVTVSMFNYTVRWMKNCFFFD